jgi:DNA invertase Pin-like site-specific DNA recombinase
VRKIGTETYCEDIGGVPQRERESTRDKNQDPEVQLVPMREYAACRGWAVVDEYVDYARAADFTRRKRWRELLADTRHRRIDLVAVWKLDRAWRSTIEGDQPS